ncbi:DC-STAMP domain-containing protein 2 isoform X1 [Rhinichthys klamathensis goyatoka]|uniref:DC-STAMP domain-containing protein 2 isoform X1 n=1 Tax=Rhinichthys klamathensis goyatoka TaxID=3034132 RepID=UPI0024B4A09F|nr:DC-STAMP domain-containing protein 2 isoform X1 [Rhinichthys klamathensis goyatoka]
MAPNRPFLKSLGRKISRLRRSSAIRQVKRSLAGFTLGLFLASVYGMTALFIQNNDLWFCVTTTGILAAFAGFGTGLSDRVRTNVMLMIPMLCSIRGKNFLLFLICTLVIHGPVSNTMENVERAADSVICGAELAMNQTQQLLQRAANPLLPALSKIKEMARNAYSMAGRAQNLIRALTESVRHVARVLRKVLHFLADIGDVCNDKLGLPYQKCTRLFDEGRENCMELLSVFSFLCHILDGFQSLCGLARVGQLFCILPSYIADHMKTALAYPTIVAFDRIKKEFEFNISTSINFDLLLNNSQSMQDAAQEIMEEVSEQMGLLLELKVLLAYMGFFLLLFMYLKAVLYKNRYLHNDKFENIYITDQFIELDRKLSRQGKAAVLPLSHRETLTYIRPCSLYLTARERRAMAGQMLSLFRYMVMTVILIAVDLMVFWVFELVHHQAQGEIVTQAPVVVAVQVNGSGYASDIFRDIAASFDILQKGNITVLSKKCLMNPLEPDYMRYLLIGLLYGFTLFIVIAGGYVKRLQRFVCARYHPEREKKRIQYLHRHILTHRGSLGKALLRAVQRNKVDQQNNGFIQTLAKHLPGGVIIARLLDINKESCMACGKMLETRGHDDEVHICPTTHCTGRYCSLCFRLMGNLCAICMGPLTFQEEQELDSSDEEQADLLEAAVTSQQTSQGIEMKKVMISFSNQDHSVWLNGQSSHQNIVVNNRV